MYMDTCGICKREFDHLEADICDACIPLVSDNRLVAIAGTTPYYIEADTYVDDDGNEVPIYERLENPGLERLRDYKAQIDDLGSSLTSISLTTVGNLVSLLSSGLDNRIAAMLFARYSTQMNVAVAVSRSKEGGTEVRFSRVCSREYPVCRGLSVDQPELFAYLKFILDARATLAFHHSPGRPFDGTIYSKKSIPYDTKLRPRDAKLIRDLYTASAQIFVWSLRVQLGDPLPDDQAEDLQGEEGKELPPAPRLLH